MTKSSQKTQIPKSPKSLKSSVKCGTTPTSQSRTDLKSNTKKTRKLLPRKKLITSLNTAKLKRRRKRNTPRRNDLIYIAYFSNFLTLKPISSCLQAIPPIWALKNYETTRLDLYRRQKRIKKRFFYKGNLKIKANVIEINFHWNYFWRRAMNENTMIIRKTSFTAEMASI